jgi:hypothetical protein
MFRRLSLAWVSSILLLGSLTGCKSDDDSEARAGRGTETCREWQSAICDAADRCGPQSDAQIGVCRHQAAGITCKSDDLAANCVAQLSPSACQSITAVGCDIRDVADSAPAVTACQQYVDALCSAAERCGQSKADCLADPGLSSLCAGAVGYTLDFEACIQKLGTLACTAASTPEVCDGVILK